MRPPSTDGADDRFLLSRFVDAQHHIYRQALAELRQGRKEGHWMWFIFPQVAGLGFSETARHFAIRGRGEAAAYLQHPLLGPRLRECSETLLGLPTRQVPEVFGRLDAMKLRSSMTLFAEVTAQDAVFRTVLKQYFEGERDRLTIDLLRIDPDHR